MKTEFEIVFSNINRDKLVKDIIKLNGICTKDNTLMKRIVFENPLNPAKSYLRVRDEWDKITCTYKEESDWILDIHSIKELETYVGDFDVMVSILKKVWLRQKSYQETYREIWEINHEIEIMIDLWPWLKPYVEIEWENEELVIKYSKLLWFNYDEAIFWTSFQVYEKELWISIDYINNLEEITFENVPCKK